MKIKKEWILIVTGLILVSCNAKTQQNRSTSSQIQMQGTWKLLKAKVIEKDDTVTTNYTQNKSFIKIINETHFAFLLHDLNKGRDSTSLFTAGGGRYSLKGNQYTEHLIYCTARNWEGRDFTFTIHIKNDTLIQRGIEKIDSLNINRLNIEKYVRIGN